MDYEQTLISIYFPFIKENVRLTTVNLKQFSDKEEIYKYIYHVSLFQNLLFIHVSLFQN